MVYLSLFAALRENDVPPQYFLSRGVHCCHTMWDCNLKVVVPVLYHHFHTSSFGGHLGVFKIIIKFLY
jgi:hypothetical protein